MSRDLQDRNSGKVGRTVICSFIEGFQRHVQGSAGSVTQWKGWTDGYLFIY